MSEKEQSNFEKEKLPITPEESNKLGEVTDTLTEFDGTKEKAINEISDVGKKLGFDVPENLEMGEKSLKEKIYLLFAPLKTKLHNYVKTLIASGGSTRIRPMVTNESMASGGSTIIKPELTNESIASGGSTIIKPELANESIASGGSTRIKPMDTSESIASGGSTKIKPNSEEIV